MEGGRLFHQVRRWPLAMAVSRGSHDSGAIVTWALAAGYRVDAETPDLCGHAIACRSRDILLIIGQ